MAPIRQAPSILALFVATDKLAEAAHKMDDALIENFHSLVELTARGLLLPAGGYDCGIVFR